MSVLVNVLRLLHSRDAGSNKCTIILKTDISRWLTSKDSRNICSSVWSTWIYCLQVRLTGHKPERWLGSYSLQPCYPPGNRIFWSYILTGEIGSVNPIALRQQTCEEWLDLSPSRLNNVYQKISWQHILVLGSVKRMRLTLKSTL